MDKTQAIDNFWNSFGLVAYEEHSIPKDIQMPYITYELNTGSFENELQLSASLWYKSTSWKDITKKADEISRIVHSTSSIAFDGGLLRLWEGGTPFAQRMADDNEYMVKRIVLNVMAEFMSAY